MAISPPVRPSLLALAKVFVLRRSDADGMKAVMQGLAPRPMPPGRRSSSLYRPWSDGRPVNAWLITRTQ